VDLPLLVVWEDFLAWLFPVLEKLPRTARFTFATRMQNLALDVISALVEARFARRKLDPLRRASTALEQLRALVRVAHGLRLLPAPSYRYASERLDETGRMLGGWIRKSRPSCVGSAPSSSG
jgi:hypothetical protein